MFDAWNNEKNTHYSPKMVRETWWYTHGFRKINKSPTQQIKGFHCYLRSMELQKSTKKIGSIPTPRNSGYSETLYESKILKMECHPASSSVSGSTLQPATVVAVKVFYQYIANPGIPPWHPWNYLLKDEIILLFLIVISHRDRRPPRHHQPLVLLQIFFIILGHGSMLQQRLSLHKYLLI